MVDLNILGSLALLLNTKYGRWGSQTPSYFDLLCFIGSFYLISPRVENSIMNVFVLLVMTSELVGVYRPVYYIFIVFGGFLSLKARR